MDQDRFEQLKKKRDEEGLSDEEANELGRMFAEQGGEEYQSADQFQAEAVEETAAELAGEAPPDRGPGTDDRPETLKDEAESRPPPAQDAPGGTRAPLGGTMEQVDRQE
jgi:hypothetical protein